MIPTRDTLGPAIAINFKFFGAVLWGSIAWAIWPEDMRGWGWGFLSIMLGVAAFGLSVNALKLMVKIYRRDKAIAELLADAKPVKSERLATADKLRAAGVIDD